MRPPNIPHEHAGIRIMSRRKQNRTCREETEPWVHPSSLGMGLCPEVAPCLGIPEAGANNFPLWLYPVKELVCCHSPLRGARLKIAPCRHPH